MDRYGRRLQRRHDASERSCLKVVTDLVRQTTRNALAGARRHEARLVSLTMSRGDRRTTDPPLGGPKRHSDGSDRAVPRIVSWAPSSAGFNFCPRATPHEKCVGAFNKSASFRVETDECFGRRGCKRRLHMPRAAECILRSCTLGRHGSQAESCCG